MCKPRWWSLYVTWLIHIFYITHWYVWHDALICVTWRIHVCETWLIDLFMCDNTHSYGWHDSLICATWLIHMCDMTHWNVRHDSLLRVTWLIHMCNMTHSYVWHDSWVGHDMSIFKSRSQSLCECVRACVRVCVCLCVCVCVLVGVYMWHCPKRSLCEEWTTHLCDGVCACVWICVCTCVRENERSERFVLVIWTGPILRQDDTVLWIPEFPKEAWRKWLWNYTLHEDF